MAASLCIVYCTVPNARSGSLIAETVVKEGLCACVNRLPGVVSHYVYEGEYLEEREELLLIKTTAGAFGRLKKRLVSLHPYEVPEIIATEVVDGNSAYLAWVEGAVT